MNTKIFAVLLLASTGVAPAFADGDAPASTSTMTAQSYRLTRAQVKDEIRQLEKCGYRVGQGDETTYPVEIQAAEACVVAKNSARSSVGGVANGSSASGSAASNVSLEK
jgi:Domain of unknown function (DUF4148)